MATNSNDKPFELDEWDPNDGSYFIGEEQPKDPYARNSVITKVDGVNAYSQASALYKGEGRQEVFYPQPGLNVKSGRMPPGKFNPEPKRLYVERNKIGFKAYGPIDKSIKRVPIISPEASGVETSTVHDATIHTTWRDLKRELGQGMGARTNKYLLEFDVPVDDRPRPFKLNVLCQATSFPQRSMAVASLWRFGRKYNLRGETVYGDTWTLTFLDDSELSIRKAMDRWIIDIDDSKLQHTALNVYESVETKLFNNPIDLIPEESAPKGFFSAYMNGLVGYQEEYEVALPHYQTDVRVYQLDQCGNKTMGYLMQNAFISEISPIEYGDDIENQLTKFSITLSFSEFLPLADQTLDDPIRLWGWEGNGL